MTSMNLKNSDVIRIWSNDATSNLWSEEKLSSSRWYILKDLKPQRKRERCTARYRKVTHSTSVIQFDNVHVLKDCEVPRLSIDARDKFESQIFLVLFSQSVLNF